MAEIGQDASRLVPRASFALAALVVAAIPALWLWSFTIDDALISIRYARHIADGLGYRFNAGGPSTDGVTPLPWPFLLRPLAHGAPLVVLARMKMLGLSLWLGTAAVWGAAVGRCEAPRAAKMAALVGLGVSVPLAAHAVSGMETALATALATGAALSYGRPRLAAVLAGLASSLRPEMLPWALVLSVMFALAGGPPARRRVVACASIAALPFVLCAVVRLGVFGRPAPLALLAKPSDLAHGIAYAAAAALVSVGPLMALSPFGVRKARGPAPAIAAAAAVHLVVVAALGGDWMPYARLLAPIVPSLLYVVVHSWVHSNRLVALVRAVAAIALGVWTLIFAAPAGRHTGPDREVLAAAVTPLVAGLRVACADVGWVSVATEADIVDLAGATDPEIAALGGGHTSKRIDGSLLLAKDPERVLLFGRESDLPVDRWREATFPRVVEARLAQDDLVDAHFAAVAFVPLGATGTGYYVLARKRPRARQDD
jgi:hypothetical protein